MPGFYAGGDIVTGAATVIAAMGAGKRAARAIDAYLREDKLQGNCDLPVSEAHPEVVSLIQKALYVQCSRRKRRSATAEVKSCSMDSEGARVPSVNSRVKEPLKPSSFMSRKAFLTASG